MIGTDAKTGKHLEGIAHLRQSIRDILTTPVGSRVMRRDYGSRLFALLDRPLNPSTRAAIAKATVEAITRWEPRFATSQVTTEVSEGKIAITMTGRYLPDGQQVRLDGIEVS